jgi:hypothetical protein
MQKKVNFQHFFVIDLPVIHILFILELKSQNLETLFYSVQVLELLDCGEKLPTETATFITTPAAQTTLVSYYQIVKIFDALKTKVRSEQHQFNNINEIHLLTIVFCSSFKESH